MLLCLFQPPAVTYTRWGGGAVGRGVGAPALAPGPLSGSSLSLPPLSHSLTPALSCVHLRVSSRLSQPRPRAASPPHPPLDGAASRARGGERRAPAPGAPQPLPVPGIAAAPPRRNSSSGPGCGAVRGDGLLLLRDRPRAGGERLRGAGGDAEPAAGTRGHHLLPPPLPACSLRPSLPPPGPALILALAAKPCEAEGESPGVRGEPGPCPEAAVSGGTTGLGEAKGRLGTGIESSTAPRAAAGSPHSPPEGKEREMIPCPRSPLPICLPTVLTSPSRVSMVLIITVFLVCTSEPRWSGLVSVGRGTQG